jgi:hypothetical protein
MMLYILIVSVVVLVAAANRLPFVGMLLLLFFTGLAYFLFWIVAARFLFVGRRAQQANRMFWSLNNAFSEILASFNPFTQWQALQQLVAVLFPTRRGRNELSLSLRNQAAEFALPFEGTWCVAKGGVTKADSHSWGIVSQRYAYDFLIPARNGDPAPIPSVLQSFLCFDRPILSPADGVVVQVCDRIRDFPYPGTGWMDWKVTDLRGNHVLIRHDNGYYSLLAHLKQHSVIVQPGQHVRKGETLGLCGNSGRSTEPHLHFQIQDGPSFWAANGVPTRFHEYKVEEADAALKACNEFIHAGMWVTNEADDCL